MFRRHKIEKVLREVGLITGGFPCQDISSAGKRAGIQLDESTGVATTRSGLFWENLSIFRMVRDRRKWRKTYWLMENVAEIYSGHLGGVLGALAAGGDDAEWDCLSSGRIGRRHLRRRFYAVAYPSEVRYGRRESWGKNEQNTSKFASLFPPIPLRAAMEENSLPKPYFVGKDDGIPNLTHRVAALGNTIDPELAEAIIRRIKEVEDESNNIP